MDKKDDERIYPCNECGKLRSKNEGGTTFTVCEECWDKAHPEPKPSGRLLGDEQIEEEYNCSKTRNSSHYALVVSIAKAQLAIDDARIEALIEAERVRIIDFIMANSLGGAIERKIPTYILLELKATQKGEEG